MAALEPALVDVGNVVQSSRTSLFLIQHLDPIYANFTMTERDLPEVQKEMARGTLKAMVRLPSDAEGGARVGNRWNRLRASDWAEGSAGLDAVNQERS